MFTALLDTCVLWPSLQRDVLLSLAVEGMYRPVWSGVILAELEYEQAAKLVRSGADPTAAQSRAAQLVAQMRRAFDDAEITGWEGQGLPRGAAPLRAGNPATSGLRRQHRVPGPASRATRDSHHRGPHGYAWTGPQFH